MSTEPLKIVKIFISSNLSELTEKLSHRLMVRLLTMK